MILSTIIIIDLCLLYYVIQPQPVMNKLEKREHLEAQLNNIKGA